MAKEYTNGFYSSKAWKECRQSFINSRMLIDGGMCQCCKLELGYIVHHINKITINNIDNNEVTLNHNNLMYVCKDCHDKIHYEDIHNKPITKHRYTFDEYGNVKEI